MFHIRPDLPGNLSDEKWVYYFEAVMSLCLNMKECAEQNQSLSNGQQIIRFDITSETADGTEGVMCVKVVRSGHEIARKHIHYSIHENKHSLIEFRCGNKHKLPRGKILRYILKDVLEII
jgi:hypothetical protein